MVIKNTVRASRMFCFFALMIRGLIFATSLVPTNKIFGSKVLFEDKIYCLASYLFNYLLRVGVIESLIDYSCDDKSVERRRKDVFYKHY